MAKKLVSVFVKSNPHGRTGKAEIKAFNDALCHEKLFLTRDQTMGKIDLPVDIKDMKKIVGSPSVSKKSDYGNTLYAIGNMFVQEAMLKDLAVDAKLSGLIRAPTLKALFGRAEFFVSEHPDKPAIVKLGAVTYFMAPYVET